MNDTLAILETVYPEDSEVLTKQKQLALQINQKYGDDHGVNDIKKAMDLVIQKIGYDNTCSIIEDIDFYIIPFVPIDKANAVAFSKRQAVWIGLADIDKKNDGTWDIDNAVVLSDVTNNTIHEIGHIYFDREIKDLYDTPKVMEFYDAVNYPIDQNRGNIYFGDLEWRERPTEWFAEAFKIYFGNPALLSYENKIVEMDNQKAINYFKKIFAR